MASLQITAQFYSFCFIPYTKRFYCLFSRLSTIISLLLTWCFSDKQAQVHTCTIVTTTKKSIKILTKRGAVLGRGGDAVEKGEKGGESGFQVLLIYMAFMDLTASNRIAELRYDGLIHLHATCFFSI